VFQASRRPLWRNGCGSGERRVGSQPSPAHPPRLRRHLVDSRKQPLGHRGHPSLARVAGEVDERTRRVRVLRGQTGGKVAQGRTGRRRQRANAGRVLRRTLMVTVAVGLLASLLLAPTQPGKVPLDIGAPLVVTWVSLSRNYVSGGDPIRLAWRVRSQWALPLIAVVTTCLTMSLAIDAVNGYPILSFVTALSIVTTGLLILPTALIVFITPESRPNKAGAPPGARIRRSRLSAWRGALLVMTPIAIARCALMATAYGWPTAVAYMLPFALAAEFASGWCAGAFRPCSTAPSSPRSMPRAVVRRTTSNSSTGRVRGSSCTPRAVRSGSRIARSSSICRRPGGKSRSADRSPGPRLAFRETVAQVWVRRSSVREPALRIFRAPWRSAVTMSRSRTMP
jgi:hypothetical protein